MVALFGNKWLLRGLQVVQGNLTLSLQDSKASQSECTNRLLDFLRWAWLSFWELQFIYISHIPRQFLHSVRMCKIQDLTVCLLQIKIRPL